MSDYKELSGAGIKVIRAAFAVALSEVEEIELARESVLDEGPSPSELLTFLDYSSMGYPMGDELIPLAELYSEKEPEPPVLEDGEPKITTLDEQLDDAKAHLYDKLLNISPAPHCRVSLSQDYPVLNRVYEKFLRHSEFAGKVSADSEQMTEAENFLFPKNEQGVPEESDAYKRYVEYSDECFDLELKIAEATTSGSSSVAELLKQKLNRVQAEWISLGKKHEVEEALEILRTSDAKAGYEDERNGFIELLESRLRTRLSSSETYAAVTISPLKPLLEPDEDGLWQRLTLSADDIKRYITEEVRDLFGIEEEELSYVLKCFKSASMDYLRVFLTREWLSKDFLKAPYWRTSSSVLSDGKGGGEIPTSISSVFFIKSAELDLSEGVDITEVGSVRSGERKKVMAYNIVKTPLMHALIQSDKKDGVDDKKKRFINSNALRKLQNVKALQSKEKRKLKQAKRIQLSSKILQTRFKPAVFKQRLNKKKAKPALKPTLVRRVQGLKLQPRMVLHTINPPTNKKTLTITGRILTNGFIGVNDVLLNYSLFDKNNNELSSKNIKLSSHGENIRFSRKLTNMEHFSGSSQTLAHTVRLCLETADGEELVTKSYEFKSKNKSISLAWNASQGTIEMALSSDITPTLFAYGLELIPKAPNPDMSLFENE